MLNAALAESYGTVGNDDAGAQQALKPRAR